MKIILSKEEVLNMVHAALCNGGLSELRMCNVYLNYTDKEYETAKKELKAQIEAGNTDNVYTSVVDGSASICLEDVITQILRGGTPLKFRDEEGGEDIEFSLEKAIENLQNENAQDIILEYKNEEDDATTGTELLQFCLYGEVIFG